MCIIKLLSWNDSVCSSLCGNSNHAYFFRPSVGASGGLLTMWDCSEVEVWSLVSQDHALIIHGRFIKMTEEFYLINVYAPCDARSMQELLVSLSTQLLRLRGQKVCVAGISMRCVGWRKDAPFVVTGRLHRMLSLLIISLKKIF